MELPVVGFVELRRLLAMGLALIAVLYLVPRLFRRRRIPAWLTEARCQKCGWTGTVSRHRPTCPRCAAAIDLTSV